MRKITKISLTAIGVLSIGLCLISIWAALGMSTMWQSIGSPPDSISKIVGVNIGSYPGGIFYKGRDTYVYVETTNGNSYYCCENTDNNGWMKTKEIINDESIFSDCQSDEGADKQYPKEILHKKLNWCGEWDSGTVIYVLRNDGEIWYKKSFSRFMTLFFSGCYIFPWIGLLSILILSTDWIIHKFQITLRKRRDGRE